MTIKNLLLLTIAVCAAMPLSAAAASMPAQLPDNQWYEVPNTKAIDVAPKQGEFANTWGVEGPPGVVNDWAGAAFDYSRGRMFLFGGGHCGYYGNEIYQYDVDSCTWTRLTNPTVVAPKPNCEYIETNTDPSSGDTTPGARHTYAGTIYLQHVDKFLMTTRHYPCNADTGTALRPHRITWIFDPFTKRWEHRYPSSNDAAGLVPFRSICDVGVYDSVTRKAYVSIGDDCYIGATGWWAYSFEANAWKRISGSGGQYDYSGFIDTKRHAMVMIGGAGYNPVGKVLTGAIDSSGIALAEKTTTGGESVLNSQGPDSDTRGQDYDRVNDVYVVWAQGKDTVWILDPNTWQWSKIRAPGGPSANPTGMYNRMRYVPKYQAFMVMTKMENNVFFFKYNPETAAHIAKSGIRGRGESGHGVIGDVFDIRGRAVRKSLPHDGNGGTAWHGTRTFAGLLVTGGGAERRALGRKVLYSE